MWSCMIHEEVSFRSIHIDIDFRSIVVSVRRTGLEGKGKRLGQAGRNTLQNVWSMDVWARALPTPRACSRFTCDVEFSG